MNHSRQLVSGPGGHAAVLLLLGLFAVGAPAQTPSPAKDRATADAAFGEAEARREKGIASEVRSALEEYETAAAIYRSLGDVASEGRALNGQGQCHLQLGQNRDAREVLECALALTREANDPSLQAEVLDGLGEALFSLGDRKGALQFLAEAEVLWRSVGKPENLVLTWNSVGLAYNELGERKVAMDYFDQAFSLAQNAGNRLYEGVIVACMGRIADDLGEWQRALGLYRQALAAAREGGDLRGEAVMMNNLGLTYYELGDMEQAVRHLEEALVLRRKAGDKLGEARSLTALGRTCFDRGETGRAAELYGLALSLSKSSGDPAGEAIAHARLGDLYESLGEPSRALEEHTEALDLRHKLGNAPDESTSLTHVGALHAKLGDSARGLEECQRALQLARGVGDQSSESDALLELARLERGLNDLERAGEYIQKAIERAETNRLNVVSPSLRASYFATVQAVYRLDVDIKMAKDRKEPGRGHEAEALEAAERMHARSLLDLLSEAGAEIRTGVDGDLLKRVRELEQLLSAKLDRQVRLRTGNHREEAGAIAREIEDLTASLEQVEADIRRTSPRYAALTQVRPLTLPEIRRLTLDEETLLLLFSIDEERSFLWVAGRSSLASFELPGRLVIETHVRRLLGAVRMRSEHPLNEPEELRRMRMARAEAEQAAALDALSGILIEPCRGALGMGRLLIVPDGILQYVPFSALSLSGTGPNGDREPLVSSYEIVMLPSASILPVLRRDASGRPRPSLTLAVLADPVFSADDERLAKRGRLGQRPSRTEPQISLLRSATDAGIADGRLSRLPFTRREADAIASLTPPDQHMEALDFAASREAATDPALADYRFIHFATHGFLDSVHPELSGVVLSLMDREANEKPGFLSAIDVYNLRLNADLVVLSGCETALGKDVKGEGLVGLTRGFMYAGTSSVMASLWKVDDAATAELMRRFYAGMLGPKKESPAAALRSAQIEMKKQKRWRDPYYWAAFVLQGEWN